jgi:hypothetical protein
LHESAGICAFLHISADSQRPQGACVAPSRADKIRFLRFVFTNGGASATTRSAFIATLETSDTSPWKGKILVASSPGSASYQVKGATGMDYSRLFEWAEAFLDYATITEAIAAIPAPVRYLASSFGTVTR